MLSPFSMLLGNNTDGKYLAKGNKWAFDVVKAPFRIPLWVEKVKGQASPLSNVKITSIACGANHVVSYYVSCITHMVRSCKRNNLLT